MFFLEKKQNVNQKNGGTEKMKMAAILMISGFYLAILAGSLYSLLPAM